MPNRPSRRDLDPDALPVVLRQRPLTKLKALLLAVPYGFVAAVSVAAVAGAANPGDGGAVVAGGLIVAFVGPLFGYWTLQLVPGSCRLEVTPAGIVVRHCFVTRRRRWDEIERFYTRTYVGYRGVPDWTGVAFAHTGEERAGLAMLAEHALRMRGIFRSDVLPDTYGLDAKELRSFLNACRVRWTGERLGHVPQRIPMTRPLAIFGFVLVAAVTGFFALAAVGAVAEREWLGAAFTVVLAAAGAAALVGMIRRWRRGTLGLQPRRHG